MATDTVIADNPPNDGREWDCQCARCGSSCVSESCDTCGGTGTMDDWTEDDWDELYVSSACDICDGEGGWMLCGSTPSWCNAHPMPGREETARGAIEWFVLNERSDEPKAVAAVDPQATNPGKTSTRV